MAKFKEAEARMFRNIYVCKKCKTKVRANPMKVLAGKVSCRRCKSKALRAIRKK